VHDALREAAALERRSATARLRRTGVESLSSRTATRITMVITGVAALRI
jgi:hypothetical protein